MYSSLSNIIISAFSSSRRSLAAAVAPPATPPTINIFFRINIPPCILLIDLLTLLFSTENYLVKLYLQEDIP